MKVKHHEYQEKRNRNSFSIRDSAGKEKEVTTAVFSMVWVRFYHTP